MKKVVLTVALALSSLFASAQLGIVTVEKNSKSTPLGFWYVVNGKGFENQMFFQNEDSLTQIELTSILAENGLDINSPKGKDEAGDLYWVVLDESGYVTYVYLIEDKLDEKYSTITVATK